MTGDRRPSDPLQPGGVHHPIFDLLEAQLVDNRTQSRLFGSVRDEAEAMQILVAEEDETRTMKVLVLEDDEYRIRMLRSWLRPHEVQWAKTARQAIDLLMRAKFDLILLDHDLDGRTFVPVVEPNTGSTVARFMRAARILTPAIVHSLNPAASSYMASLLPHAEAIPWGEDLASRLLSFALQGRPAESGPPQRHAEKEVPVSTS